jgi:hypothetical protein
MSTPPQNSLVLHASVWRGYLEWERRSAPTGVEEGGTGGADEGEGGAAVVAVTELVQRRVGGDAARDLLLASDLDGKAPSGYERRRRGETGAAMHTLDCSGTAPDHLRIPCAVAMILEKLTT